MDDGSLTLREFWKLSAKERCERYKDLTEHDKFGVRQMDTGAVKVTCNDCIYYRGYAKCEAFPNGITGDHIDAVMEDRNIECGPGIRFAPKKK